MLFFIFLWNVLAYFAVPDPVLRLLARASLSLELRLLVGLSGASTPVDTPPDVAANVFSFNGEGGTSSVSGVSSAMDAVTDGEMGDSSDSSGESDGSRWAE